MAPIHFRCTGCGSVLSIDPTIATSQSAIKVACPYCRTVNQYTGQSTANASSGNPAGGEVGSTSTGLSVLGLLLAALVGFIAMIIWIVIVMVSGHELGIIAWGIGAAIGFVAGVIAKNSSPVYCGLAAVIAGLTIVFAKLGLGLIFWGLYAGLAFVDDLPFFFGEGDKYTHSYIDQGLADGQFEVEKKKIAERLVADYFEVADSATGDLEAHVSEDSVTGQRETTEFFKEIKKHVDSASREEREGWLEKSRARHPEWIDEEIHRIAAMIELVGTPGKLSSDLAEQAKYEINNHCFGYSDLDEDYVNNLSLNEQSSRNSRLRKLVVELLLGKTTQERQALVERAAQLEPKFIPDPYLYTAVLEREFREEKLSPEDAAQAKKYLDGQFDDPEMTYYKSTSQPEFRSKEEALRRTIQPKLRGLDESTRKQLVDDLKKRQPSWYVGEYQEDDGVSDLDEAGMTSVEEDESSKKENFGDGTFLGSLKKVTGPLDILWLLLGTITAFGGAMAQGRKTSRG
jgi:phage FluMu protein Com